MCTHLTEHVEIDGSGKGPAGWFGADRATVYVDHAVHAPYTHTVNIDVINPQLGPSARVTASSPSTGRRTVRKRRWTAGVTSTHSSPPT